jgi:FixJ family two-component response regulator
MRTEAPLAVNQWTRWRGGVPVQAVSPPAPTVFVVDDDACLRETVEDIIGDAGWRTETFGSAREFLARPPSREPSCLVVDIDLPDLDGLELQATVASERPHMPVIFMAGRSDVEQIVRAMKAGAADFLAKPLSQVALLGAARSALDRSEAALREEAQRQQLADRYALLSRREREVMALVVAGRLNKQVGGDLGISEITVKAHRGRVMEKMQARSFAGLVTMGWQLGLAVANA